jgi:hypothetical protein
MLSFIIPDNALLNKCTEACLFEVYNTELVKLPQNANDNISISPLNIIIVSLPLMYQDLLTESRSQFMMDYCKLPHKKKKMVIDS